jgi:ABC-type multidrug transport system fused ATPase/permease subunit
VRGTLWRHRRLGGLVLALSLLAALFEGSTMGVFALALETLTGEQGKQSLAVLGRFGTTFEEWRAGVDADTAFLVLVGAAVVSQLVKSGLELSAKASSARLSTSVEGHLRRSVFRQFLSMRFARISRYKVGDLGAYLQQAGAVASFTSNLFESIYQAMAQLAYVAILLWISWKMTLVAGALLLVLVLATRGIMVRLRITSRQLVRAATSMNSNAIELLGGIRHVHTYGREGFAEARVAADIDAGVDARRRGLVMAATIPAMMQSAAALGVAALLVAATRVIGVGDEGSLAALLTFVLVLYRLIPRVTTMNNKLALLEMAWANVERVADILRRDDKEYLESGDRPFPALRERLELRRVSLSYGDDGPPAVARLSLDVPKGSMVALVGPSGSGKSSVVNLLLRLYDPTEGTIAADGHPLAELRIGDWRDAIGLVDQDPFIFHDTVRENIRFGNLQATDDEIEEAARIAAADGFIRELPDGYDTVVGERGTRLSGGQRQRLSIARAVVRRASILILDEATSALDSESERAIQEALDRLRDRFTVVAIAHRLSTIAMADEIVVLDGGAVVDRGTHDELLSRDGVYARMWRLQAAAE